MFLGLSAYFWLLLATLVLPLAFRRLHPTDPFRENRLALYLSILAVTLLFGFWDVWAVWRGHWDFNPDFVWDSRFLGLPLEEWLFYPVVAYASLLIWSVIKKYDSWRPVWVGLIRHFEDGRLPWGFFGRRVSSKKKS